jgi:hypothetical protein
MAYFAGFEKSSLYLSINAGKNNEMFSCVE